MSNQQGAKIIVYWLEKSRAQRIIWLLEELNLEYEIKVFKRNADYRAGPELREVHPLGRSPTIGITPLGTEKEIIITESATIIDYICDHFGKDLRPQRFPEGKDGMLGAETEQWMRYRFLLDYSEGSFFTLLMIALVVSNIKKAPVPWPLTFVTRGIADRVDGSYLGPEFKLHCDFLEDYLATSPSTGDFFCEQHITGADIMMHFALEAAVQRVPLNESNYPKLYSFVRRLQDRDAYKRAADRVSKASGDKYVPFSDLKKS